MTNTRLFPSVLLLLLLTATLAVAQQDDTVPTPSPAPAQNGAARTQQAQPAQQPQTTPSPSPTPEPRVVRMVGHLELDDIVEVYIENLSKWVEANGTNEPNKLVPYLNGRA